MEPRRMDVRMDRVGHLWATSYEETSAQRSNLEQDREANPPIYLLPAAVVFATLRDENFF
jgi:hypothetical protein